MKKSIVKNDAYYSIMWSFVYPYDKHSASRILPEVSGIICLLEKIPGGEPKYLLFHSCWREGLRYGLKIFFDYQFSKFPNIRDSLEKRELLYRYTIVDSNPFDMKDIMYLLINCYMPEFNSLIDFSNSDRYDNMYIREMTMRKDETIEKFPIFNP